MIWIELIVCAALIFWVGSLLSKCIAIAGMHVGSIVLLYVLVYVQGMFLGKLEENI